MHTRCEMDCLIKCWCCCNACWEGGGVRRAGCVGRVEESSFCLAGLAMPGCFDRGGRGGSSGWEGDIWLYRYVGGLSPYEDYRYLVGFIHIVAAWLPNRTYWGGTVMFFFCFNGSAVEVKAAVYTWTLGHSLWPQFGWFVHGCCRLYLLCVCVCVHVCARALMRGSAWAVKCGGSLGEWDW